MKAQRIINYSRQNIDKSDINYVISSLKKDIITQGNYVSEFENKLKSYLKSKYCFAVSSGTSGLYLAAKALNWKKNDKIIISPFTFAAAANVCKLLEFQEIFLDINYDDLSLDINLLEKKLKKSKIKGVIITDYGGLPSQWDKIYSLKKKYKFDLINDNCHSLGSKYKNDTGYAAKYADIVIQSFHPVKHITTAEGGSILTNNKSLVKRLENLRSHGIVRNKLKHWIYDIIEPSLNFRISDLNCALGLSQLRKLTKKIHKKRQIAKSYDNFFNKYSIFRIPKNNSKFYNSYHLYPLIIDFKKTKTSRDILIRYFLKNKIRLQVHYVPTYRMKIFSMWNKKKFPITERVFKSIVSIPIYENLEIANIIKIKKLFIKFFNLR